MGKSIFGTDDDDGLDGSNGNDTIIGYAGNDVISGGNGDDILIGDGLSSGARVRLVSTDSDGIIGGAASFNASFAPNGTQIVFESDAVNFAGADGVRSIYTKDLVTGALTLISAAQNGTAANANSSNAHFSADGKSVVFTSLAGNLTGASDTNAGSDIFIKNLTTGAVSVVSTMKNGSQGTGDSDFAALSSDGTKVLFQSTAEDLVGNDSNGYSDIFVKNLKTGTVRLVSADGDGVEGNGGSGHAVFSSDGKLIAFESTASSFVSGDSNGVADVFVKDLVSDDIMRVSSAKDGTVGNASSSSISFNADANKAIFTSNASNLVGYDNNDVSDVFIKNLNTGGVRLVSTNADGVIGDGASFGGVFSPDGTMIAFFSNATNLVDDDTNGVTDAFVKDLVSGDVYRVSLANSGVEGNFASTVITWSPDGKQLVFQSVASNLTNDTNTNNTHDVFVATLDFPSDGDDVLDGGAGRDTFLPGGGSDSVTGGAGDDIVYFNDQLTTGDTFDGGDGYDTMVLDGTYSELVTLDTGFANIEKLILKGKHAYNFKITDAVIDNASFMTVDGSTVDAAHSIQFDGSAETHASMTFIAGAGVDSFKAGGGDDIMAFGASFTAADKFDGAGGNDLVILDGNYAGGVTCTATTLANVETLQFIAGHSYKLTIANTFATSTFVGSVVDATALGAEDSLTFNGGAEDKDALTIRGGAGDDVTTGGAGNDSLDLTRGGSDTANGGAGFDKFKVGAALSLQDKLNGGADYDTLEATQITGIRAGSFGITATMMVNVEEIDLLDGGSGFNFTTADGVIGAGKTLVIDATALTANGVTFSGAAETNGSFTFMDSTQADRFTGGGGADLIEDFHGGGGDTLNGGGGDDRIQVTTGGLAGATINGGTGTDTIEFMNTTGSVFTLQHQWLTGIERIETDGQFIMAVTDATLSAGQAITVDASFSANFLSFDGSAETNGLFTLIGSGSGDNLTGGAKNDVLMGGGSSDSLHGGGGSDTFKYSAVTNSSTKNGPDRIDDFNAASDKIDLWFAVSGAVNTVTIASMASSAMDSKFASSLNAAHLDVHHAAVVKVTGGTGAGTYLGVEANGVAGYQAQKDLVIDITGATHLTSLDAADFI